MVYPLALRYVSTGTQTDSLDRVIRPAEVPSEPKIPECEGFNLACLEIFNSIYQNGYHPDDICKGLAELPEPYESLPVRVSQGDGIECQQKESEEHETPDAPPGVGNDEAPLEPPVVSVPGNNPPCPRCSTRFTRMPGLIDHLKRAHGQKVIIFECSKCGKQDPKYHSITCHVPKCAGKVNVDPTGDWLCDVCQRGFTSKIGLGQHKRIAHPLVRNLERIAASRPKESSLRGAHKKVWTEEEEALLRQLMVTYADQRNINQRIAEHIPSKTAKQISDKRRLLAEVPPTSAPSLAEGRKKRTANHPGSTVLPQKGLLKGHYRSIIKRWLSRNKVTNYRGAFQKILDGQDPQRVVNDLYEEFLNLGLREHRRKEGAKKSRKSQVRKARKDKTKEKRKMADQKPSDNKANWIKKRTVQKRKYQHYQFMFRMHRGRLARLIMDNTEALKCQIPSDVVHATFKARWETPASFKGLEAFPPYTGADNYAFEDPITAKEIEKNVKEMDKASAPGPDGITLGHLSKIDPEFSMLSEIFNLWLFTGTFPDALRDCRTVLIPKSTDKSRLSNINNWRPITIASTVLRLFSRIITARLSSACPLNARQKGFTRAPGCSENLKLLELLVRFCKQQKHELGVVFVDIAKAFDTVSHQHIITGLRERGVDPHIIHLVSEMYRDITTTIDLKKGRTDPIKILTGVKQGDPMSPVLFNLALDPLICKLEREGEGFHQDGFKITAMAFADDLVLLSDSWVGMCSNIKILETFCQITGLQTQGEKCHGFYIKPTRDSYTINDCPAWEINGTPLNMIHPGESEKYLGLRIDPWVGLANSGLSEKLKYWLHQIGDAPLKPLQKVDILRTFTIPRLIYLADHTEIKSGLLESLDLMVRNVVKEWLHLPSCTCDAIFYSSLRDGGLGLLKLTALIPSVQARRLHRLAQSSDVTLRDFLREEHLESMYEKLWIRAGGDKESIPDIWEPILKDPGPKDDDRSEWEKPAPKICYPKPCNWRKKEFHRWKQLVSQGHGIQMFENDNISNGWIKRSRGIPHRQLLTALQLRANVYPTREFLARGRGEDCVRSCRHCNAEFETTAHIIGNCPITQDARIKRHNSICEKLSEEAKRCGWTVFQEPHIRSKAKELYKPDLIFVKENKAYVVDVTVRFEHGNSSLKDAAEEKVRKYQHLLPQIRDLVNAANVEFVGFPLGSRGKWYKQNSELLLALGLSKARLERTARALASRALFSSVDIVHIFVSKSKQVVTTQ